MKLVGNEVNLTRMFKTIIIGTQYLNLNFFQKVQLSLNNSLFTIE